MSNVVYQLTMEDIYQFLTNREHLNEVTRRGNIHLVIWKS